MDSCIAILDVGKTNKKALVFNSEYEVIYESSTVLPEIKDEDGYPCEDISALSQWVLDTIHELIEEEKWNIRAINFSGYGASFVLVDAFGQPVAPLYNYLKPLAADFVQDFCNQYGGEKEMALVTSSPLMGNLNSGLQLYRLKKMKPEIYRTIVHAIHLPQYLSYLFTQEACSDLTSMGCHTLLWDYKQSSYAEWVNKENLNHILAPIYPSDKSVSLSISDKQVTVGIGLHDSSAALIPYLACFHEPFVLLSTGTWCIALNPFNDQPLTLEELNQDCLCYLSFQGKSVKASRLFAGHEHEEQVIRIANHFNIPKDFYHQIDFTTVPFSLSNETDLSFIDESGLKQSGFARRASSDFIDPHQTYCLLISDLVKIQVTALQLILNKEIRQIFVDGGFSKNVLFMKMLAKALPDYNIVGASVAQASAIGAALAIHSSWNKSEIPVDLVKLKRYED